MCRRLQGLHRADYPVREGKLANQHGALMRMQPASQIPGGLGSHCGSTEADSMRSCKHFRLLACWMACLTSLCSSSTCLT